MFGRSISISRGLYIPQAKQGDDLAGMVLEAVMEAARQEGFLIHNKDVVGVAQSALAAAQGNYTTVDQIAAEISRRFDGPVLGILFAPYSRNRFYPILRAACRAKKQVELQLSYPGDGCGCRLCTLDACQDAGIDPWQDVLDKDRLLELAGTSGPAADHLAACEEIAAQEGCRLTIRFGNRPVQLLEHTSQVLVACNANRRHFSRRLLQAGAHVLCLDDLLTAPAGEGGWQPDYGLLGCSRADGERVLLLPRDCNEFCARLQSLIQAQAGDTVQVLVFGSADGHEPTLANGLTPGLEGEPLETRLRYMADHLFSGRAEDSTADETRYLDRRKAQWQKIHDRPAGDVTLAGQLGQLCYNVSISADGTPAVLVQGFFNSQQP